MIKAYFHGDKNYNEFYTWNGVNGTIDLPVFRVDSPMKGEYSSADERSTFLYCSYHGCESTLVNGS